jgi:hypothetical protein
MSVTVPDDVRHDEPVYRLVWLPVSTAGMWVLATVKIARPSRRGARGRFVPRRPPRNR